MSIFRAFTGAFRGTLADQWKDIITAGPFSELTAVAPGVLQQPSDGRGTYNNATNGVITNGSLIYVPENSAAFVFSRAGIEDIITEAGGYVYQDGQSSIFNGDGIGKAILKQTMDRIFYGGQTAEEKRVAFVNLREIRGIRFGTRSPLMYHDSHYGADLEITAYGVFSLQIIDAEKFIRNYMPPKVYRYSFDDSKTRSQITSEFVQSLTVALNALSASYRISQIPSQANEVAAIISAEKTNAGAWKERFGFQIVQIAIENIEFSPESRELVKQYSSKQMDWKVYENVSQQSSNIAAQQKIAQGVQDHGLGNIPGMMFGMGLVQGLNPQNVAQTEPKATVSIDQQIETLKKLKDLLDVGILSEDEFNAKKKEIIGI